MGCGPKSPSRKLKAGGPGRDNQWEWGVSQKLWAKLAVGLGSGRGSVKREAGGSDNVMPTGTKTPAEGGRCVGWWMQPCLYIFGGWRIYTESHKTNMGHVRRDYKIFHPLKMQWVVVQHHPHVNWTQGDRGRDNQWERRVSQEPWAKLAGGRGSGRGSVKGEAGGSDNVMPTDTNTVAEGGRGVVGWWMNEWMRPGHKYKRGRKGKR